MDEPLNIALPADGNSTVSLKVQGKTYKSHVATLTK